MRIGYVDLLNDIKAKGFRIRPLTTPGAVGADVDSIVGLRVELAGKADQTLLKRILAEAGYEWDLRIEATGSAAIVDRKAGELSLPHSISADPTAFRIFKFTVETEPGVEKPMHFKEWVDCKDAWVALALDGYRCSAVFRHDVEAGDGSFGMRQGRPALHVNASGLQKLVDDVRKKKAIYLRERLNEHTLDLLDNRWESERNIVEFEADWGEDANDVYLFVGAIAAEEPWMELRLAGVSCSPMRTFKLTPWAEGESWASRCGERTELHPDAGRLRRKYGRLPEDSTDAVG